MDISDTQESIHIKDYLYVLWHKRYIAMLFFITTVLIVTAGSFLMWPVYRAITTLMIDVESPNILTATGSIEMQSQNYYSYKEYLQSQMEIIISDPIIKKVFNEFNIGNLKEYAEAREPVKEFLKTIKVEPVRDTRLLKLSVENKDPDLAAKIPNRIAEIYVRRNLSYISKNELLNLLKNEYLRLEAKSAEYSKVFKGDHPEAIKLKQEMAEVVDKIGREKNSALTYGIDNDDLKSDYKHALEGLKANNISIISLAEKPVVPIRPNKRLNVLLAFVVGLFGGIGLAFFVEYLDDTIKDLEFLEKLTNWPFLGSIPKIDASGKNKEVEKDLFVHTKPHDPISELYRSIRTNVFFASTDENPLKCIIVASPGPQEGKSMTVCNLGIAVAQSGKQVLLVDADMRKSRLHNVFKKEDKIGLSNFLSGKETFEALPQATGVENLFLISSGPAPINPSELLDSNKMKEFISAAKNRFDFILFDTPPISMLADAIILSRIVDGVIVVIESGKTSKRMLMRLKKLLTDTKVRIVGMVFNKSLVTRSNYNYYSYYYRK